MTEDIYRLALVCVPKVGAQTAKTLLSYCGSAEGIFTASRKALLAIPGIGAQLVNHIQQPDLLDRATREWDHMQEQGIRLVFYQDPEYPKRLRSYFDAPVGLFLSGNHDLNASKILSIVGTRKPTREGLQICTQLINELRSYQPTIVSGMAYGIDICAHRAAMEQDLPTIGVLAHGHGYLYPTAHRADAERMLSRGGLISEYPRFVYPEKEYFPMRNRIVAGMCDALIVIETGERGGSIITANLANGYHKDVFAVPGRLSDPRSKGCNQLIKSHRASLLESANDISYIMGWDATQSDKQQQTLFSELSEEEKNIVALLEETGPVSVDWLCYQSQQSNSKVAALLLELECRGIVLAKPGNRFTLVPSRT